MESWKKLYRGCFLILFVMLWTGVVYSTPTSRAGGLLFRSLNYPVGERTSLDISAGQPFLFENSFAIGFELAFWRNTDYGTIFRAENQDGNYFEFVYVPLNREVSLVKLLCNGMDTGLELPLERNGLIRNCWMKLELFFNLKEDRISLLLNEKKRSETICPLPSSMNLEIELGATRKNSNVEADVPHMAVKNLFLQGDDGEYLAFWELGERDGIEARDLISGRVAQVVNPCWLINDHYYWTKKATFFTDPMPGLAYDALRQRVLIINSDHLIDFRVQNNSYYEVVYARECNNLKDFKYAIYDNRNDRIVTYGVDLQKVNWYDEKTNTWKISRAMTDDHQSYWNHSSLIDEFGNRLVTLGGYSSFEYRNSVRTFDFASGQWSSLTMKGDPFSGRCLSAVGPTGKEGEYLIFGGYGSVKGQKKREANNLYDLYRLNLKDSTITRLWDLDRIVEDFVPVHSLFFDKPESCFYSLCYNHKEKQSHLRLWRFNLESAHSKPVSNEIPFELKGDLKYDADLFYNQQTKEFVAVTRTEVTPDSSRVDIYTMFYPIVENVEIFSGEKVSFLFAYRYHIGIFAFSILLLFSIWARKKLALKKRDGERTKMPAEMEILEDSKERSSSDYPSSVGMNFEMKTVEHKSNSLYLFGDFLFNGKEKTELTDEFSPKRLQLFLLMLLHYQFNTKGITSRKLNDILWPDHSAQSAKNNRGVNVRKLRSILEQARGISIVFSNNYWSVEISDEFYCDFLHYLELKKKLEKDFEVTILEELLLLLKRGIFLEQQEFNWLDGMKDQVNDEVIQLLLKISNEQFLDEYPDVVIKLADVILKFDSLNDDAFEMKFQFLRVSGKQEEARKLYQEFSLEYQMLYQEDYPRTLDEMLEGKSHML